MAPNCLRFSPLFHPVAGFPVEQGFLQMFIKQNKFLKIVGIKGPIRKIFL
jgi:hypothetical protein